MKVIVINGPMGVGKTTVGKYIAESCPGTAFIDGDWCMDIHPFVGNRETRAMAADNILHMIGNYSRCTACSMVVLAWLMDETLTLRSIERGIADMQLELRSVTLTCGADVLTERWKNDTGCEWRTEYWLGKSLESLEFFSSLDNAIDTGGLSVERIADIIIKG